ncbi:TPA: radical SAM protein, partial [Candidatus Bipolaricaulota bacterium]|nr:radical SAM protein [Candidatus Bipolaricaulota bacterium]
MIARSVYEHAVERLKSGLAIVFDLTYWCDLACRGCGVNAHLLKDLTIKQEMQEASTQDIINILHKFREYLDEHPHTRFYLNFGGGEPFLRQDLKEIVQESAMLFGAENIAIDTNGTVATLDLVREITNYVAC